MWAGEARTQSFGMADAAAERLRDKMRGKMMAKLAETQPPQLYCIKADQIQSLVPVSSNLLSFCMQLSPSKIACNRVCTCSPV